MRRIVVLALPLVAACVAAACVAAACAADRGSPRQVVTDLYDARVAARIDGAPTVEQLAEIAPMVSDTLRALLDAARRIHDSAAVHAPGEKPPFAEGDLFSSLFEGPTSFQVLDDGSTGGRVRVKLTRAGEAGSAPVVWEDRAVVSEERGRWVVTDVEYGGNWDFANKGTLRTTLEHALADTTHH